MDALTALLDGPRAQGAFLLRSLFAPPWALRIEDEAPLTVVAVVRGTACVAPDDGPAVALDPGDVAVVRGPVHYTVADAPDTPPFVHIGPGQVCTTLAGEPLAEPWSLGVRTWGPDPDAPTVLLTGTYEQAGEVTRRLLDALPTVITQPADAASAALVELLAGEIAREDPGQEAVLDRLLDLLLVTVVRAWFARPDAEAPAWYAAHGDPIVGPALRLMEHNPAAPWTVAMLASEIGVSRAALARRFTALVGEPPMAFLTGWRIALAADLLREPGATIGSVAHRVGYASPFALSTAFKRLRGVSPAEHRRTTAAA